MTEVQTGDVIAGKFQIERVLGEGGMGYVVAARHLQLGQMVALKFMREEVLTEDYRSRFLREARNTVRLKSKHVSRVLDVGEIDSGVPYMVMEYLEGTDLSALLQKRGSFPPTEACDYIIQACEAIAEAHGHGIVHRDLKPANLFLTQGTGGEPVIKVLDFGVSKVLELGVSDETSRGGGRPEYEHAHDTALTKATDLLGSPSYMSPEQVVSARDADERSDVWSLGVILYRLISGKAPFTGNSLGDLIQNIIHGPLPNLRDLRPDLPEGLEHVLWRAMERDKSQRPDVVELARMLAPYAGPNAAPSLERIAILGPALVASLPPPVLPSGTGPSFPIDSKSSWTAPPLPSTRTQNTSKKDMSTGSFLGWIALFVFVVGAIAFIGVKLPKLLGTARPTPPPSVPAPPSPPPATAVPPPLTAPPTVLPTALAPPTSPTTPTQAPSVVAPPVFPSHRGPVHPRKPPPSTTRPSSAESPTPTTAPTSAPTQQPEIPQTRD